MFVDDLPQLELEQSIEDDDRSCFHEPTGMSIPSSPSNGVGTRTEAQALLKSGDAVETRGQFFGSGVLGSHGSLSERLGEHAALDVVGWSFGHDHEATSALAPGLQRGTVISAQRAAAARARSR